MYAYISYILGFKHLVENSHDKIYTFASLRIKIGIMPKRCQLKLKENVQDK
jgi:hypothetical protein